MEAGQFNHEHLHSVLITCLDLPDHTGPKRPGIGHQKYSYSYLSCNDFIKQVFDCGETGMLAQKDWEKSYLKKVIHAQD